MCASPLRFLRSGPPPPKVAFLPDALFFTRAVPVTAGATAAEAASQIELALESVAPFPLSQLYYGWFWKPGAEHALAFAAYRRRFTSDQIAGWEGAELVLPAFASVVGADVDPATTILLHAPDSVTAVHWEKTGVPTRVLARPLDPDTAEEQRGAARDELLRQVGGSRKVIELEEMPQPDPSQGDRETVFRARDFVARLPVAVSAAMDVRDKDELAALRTARKRDLVLWRAMVACAAALLLIGLGELALIGGDMWQDVRLAKIRAQKPAVDQIEASQRLANRIEEIMTKRLLPFEMISALLAENRKPEDIRFSRVVTSDIYTLVVSARAPNISQVSAYVATLRNLPFIERVEERETRTRGDAAEFQLVVTFKPDALKPADSISQ